MTSASRIATLLNLKPLAVEGAYFVETYRSAEQLPEGSLPERYAGARSFSTAIYYLITASTFSAMHRLLSDEVYHFYLGDPIELLAIRPDGSFRVHTLGTDVLGGMEPQVVVPRGVWQGARMRPGGEFALLGTTVAPGFDRADYEHGRRAALMDLCPDAGGLIEVLADQ
jgi:predicted cupin superfamily sugar epimerase